MKYPLTFFWPRFIPDHAAACARMCFIFIRPKYRDDEGLYQHELMHIKQWAFVTLVSALLLAAVYLPLVCASVAVHALLYLAVPKYKLMCEVQAYKKQLRYYPDDRTVTFARFIANHYNLSITESQALERLRK